MTSPPTWPATWSSSATATSTARDGLDDRTRQLAAISALTALGGAEPQLEYHIGIALNVGVEPGEIVETIIHLAPFLGFARTLNAARSAKRVFAARGVSPPGRTE